MPEGIDITQRHPSTTTDLLHEIWAELTGDPEAQFPQYFNELSDDILLQILIAIKNGGVGGASDLQAVTDVGFLTDNPIIFDQLDGEYPGLYCNYDKPFQIGGTEETGYSCIMVNNELERDDSFFSVEIFNSFGRQPIFRVGGGLTLLHENEDQTEFFKIRPDGTLVMQDVIGGGEFNGKLTFQDLTENRIFAMPDKSGTVAMLDDLPGIVDGVPDLQTVLSVDYATNIRAEFNGGLVVEGILDMGISEIRYSSVGSLFTGSLKCGENFTEDQTLFLPNESGTIATIENITLQSITDNGNVTTNSIKLKFDATGFIGDLNVTGNALSDNRNYDLPDESGTIALNKRAVNILEFTDNADAISNGLTAGEMYRTGDVLKVVH